MVARESAALRVVEALPRSSVLANLWPNRSAANRRVDPRGQARRSVSTPNAQIHLDADATGSLNHARATHQRLHVRGGADFAESAGRSQVPQDAWAQFQDRGFSGR